MKHTQKEIIPSVIKEDSSIHNRAFDATCSAEPKAVLWVTYFLKRK
jgi:hypothetical protein